MRCQYAYHHYAHHRHHHHHHHHRCRRRIHHHDARCSFVGVWSGSRSDAEETAVLRGPKSLTSAAHRPLAFSDQGNWGSHCCLDETTKNSVLSARIPLYDVLRERRF